MSGTIEAAIFSGLTDASDLTALVDTRIWPRRDVQGATLPNIVYFRVDTPRSYTMGTDTTSITPRYQFDIRAADYDTCLSVAAQLRMALNGLSFQNVDIADERDMSDTDGELYLRQIDAVIMTSEALA